MVALAAPLVLGACGGPTGTAGGGPTAPSSTAVTSTPGRHGGAPERTWIFAERALRETAAAPAARQVLARGRIFEILRPRQRPLAGLPVVPTASFASYQAMVSAFAGNTVDPWIQAVLYDNEAWLATPAGEQHAPGTFMAEAARLVHRHHLVFLSSPALDLAAVLQPGAGPLDQAYLRLGLAGEAASGADFVDIQAQSTETDPARYASLVSQAGAQARRSNPKVVVVAGLSTNPGGAPVSAAQLAAAARVSNQMVQGYWVNIPSPGQSCPACSAPRPDLAITLVEALGQTSPSPGGVQGH